MIGALIIIAVLVVSAIALWAHVEVHRARVRRASDYTMRFDEEHGPRIRRIERPDGSNFFADVRGAKS